jgi:hypothetical protein
MVGSSRIIITHYLANNGNYYKFFMQTQLYTWPSSVSCG